MIRRADKSDADRIQQLLYQVQKVHAMGRPDLFKQGGIKYSKEELLEILEDDERPVFVYLNEADVVQGYVFGIYERVDTGNTSLVEQTTFYIDDLCVEESVRGRHIGKMLYEYVLKEAKRTGCRRVTLHVWDCNPGAMKFYETMGLLPVNRTLEKIL